MKLRIVNEVMGTLGNGSYNKGVYGLIYLTRRGHYNYVKENDNRENLKNGKQGVF